jgi:hypothetical protein
MFFLNKKLFNVHAEHHHQFSPAWLKQFTGSVSTAGTPYANAFGLGTATNKSAYMVTFKDKIKLKTKLSARGSDEVSLLGGAGWTGIDYTDVPATDQLFTLTWCSQGGGGADVGKFDIYGLEWPLGWSYSGPGLCVISRPRRAAAGAITILSTKLVPAARYSLRHV